MLWCFVDAELAAAGHFRRPKHQSSTESIVQDSSAWGDPKASVVTSDLSRMLIVLDFRLMGMDGSSPGNIQTMLMASFSADV